jgi:hypothetical protein
MRTHLDAAQKALTSGDLVTWAEEQKKFVEAFERLEKIKRQP